jgi:cell division protein FtsB
MRKRRTTRYNLPTIHLPGIKLPNVNLPKVNLPKVKAPKVNLPRVQIPYKPILAVAVMVVLALAMMNLNSRLGDYYRLSSQRDVLKGQVDNLKATKEVLQTQLAFAQSDKAVEEYARDSHQVREGEKLLVISTPQDNVVQQATQTTQEVKRVQNWEIWWTLFFGQNN